MDPLVSIIIRTKNEERWINLCLKKIYSQDYKNYEIIIVDNNSKDKTLDKIKDFKIKKILNLNKYLPGKALNLGIKQSSGELLVFISAHCIPVNDRWLTNLVQTMQDNVKCAGVYGRQEPMNFSNDYDLRDLFLLFGLDKKTQIKDSFFHNANSCIRKNIWKKIPFDNTATNIEDRLWAKKVLKLGYNICYEPSASVYHYHGVHQNNNNERLKNIVKIVGNKIYKSKGKINPSELNIIASIPIKGLCLKLKKNYLIDFSLSHLKKSKYINEIIVSTDNLKTKKNSK